MTRSIFDPTGPNTEHSGTRNLGPDAANISHMPSDITDGKVSEEEVREQAEAGDEEAQAELTARTKDPGGVDNVGFDASGQPEDVPLDDPDATIIPPPDDLSNPGREGR